MPFGRIYLRTLYKLRTFVLSKFKGTLNVQMFHVKRKRNENIQQVGDS